MGPKILLAPFLVFIPSFKHLLGHKSQVNRFPSRFVLLPGHDGYPHQRESANRAATTTANPVNLALQASRFAFCVPNPTIAAQPAIQVTAGIISRKCAIKHRATY
jgi:hypothetical protein